MGKLDGLSGTGDSDTAMNFDLAAAWLRHAEADRGAFLTRFIAIVSEALPNHTQVQKVRRGLLRKTEEVVGVAVAFENETYLMRMRDGHHLTTEIEKKVRGVVLSTREVDAHAWMTGLMTHVRERTEQARAMSEMLAAL
ncbi:hypothetical protein [Trinickia dinghuensis]|uniref:Uncharacterized protein n=1 Tax=Trinickia dinghuensis TaxID=2291023 RepID=A0A3D8K5S7_9BURK|nr:hypothetical protein [Trinickia dinghuensis]RDV00227.1 hypothetical protein DWV00_04100 [Trinickia dinghuensis]